jgi:hypothetical protein
MTRSLLAYSPTYSQLVPTSTTKERNENRCTVPNNFCPSMLHQHTKIHSHKSSARPQPAAAAAASQPFHTCTLISSPQCLFLVPVSQFHGFTLLGTSFCFHLEFHLALVSTREAIRSTLEFLQIGLICSFQNLLARRSLQDSGMH